MRGLTAREFFDLELPGGKMSDAHRATGISYQTIHAHTRHGVELRAHRARRLQTWSLDVGAAHGVYLSAARTLGLSDPCCKATGTEG